MKIKRGKLLKIYNAHKISADTKFAFEITKGDCFLSIDSKNYVCRYLLGKVDTPIKEGIYTVDPSGFKDISKRGASLRKESARIFIGSAEFTYRYKGKKIPDLSNAKEVNVAFDPKQLKKMGKAFNNSDPDFSTIDIFSGFAGTAIHSEVLVSILDGLKKKGPPVSIPHAAAINIDLLGELDYVYQKEVDGTILTAWKFKFGTVVAEANIINYLGMIPQKDNKKLIAKFRSSDIPKLDLDIPESTNLTRKSNNWIEVKQNKVKVGMLEPEFLIIPAVTETSMVKVLDVEKLLNILNYFQSNYETFVMYNSAAYRSLYSKNYFTDHETPLLFESGSDIWLMAVMEWDDETTQLYKER